MDDKAPRMRDDIELIPLRYGDRQTIMVRDPLGLIKEPIVLDPAIVPVLALLNGDSTIGDLRLMLTRSQGGVLFTTNDILKILEQLSSAFLLEDERVAKARDEIVSRYAALPVRQAFHAGVAYPADRDQLTCMLDEILIMAKQETSAGEAGEAGKAGEDGAGGEAGGAGTAGELGEAAAREGGGWPPSEAAIFPHEDIVALAAPHMEIDVSARCYAVAYNQIMGAPLEIVFVLGTGHSLRSKTFCLTTKDFETPLGTALTDRKIVEELGSSAPGCILDNDMPHRHEHSIEFQVIFLQHVLQNPQIRIVPILCGSFRNQLEAHNRASEVPCAGDFLRKLSSVISRETEQTNGRCLVVAGVDFSHVGRKFGDEFTGRTLVQESTEYDGALIRNLCEWNAEGFWQVARNVNDRYKVCGFAPLASLLETLPRAKGHLLGYDVCHDDATHSAVSFASIVFTKS